MALAEAIILCRVPCWKVFGTGTFTGSAVFSEATEKKLVFAFLYQAADLANVPFGRLLWTTRREHGELGQRVHYHWLLGSKEWTPTVGQCFTLNHLWDALPRCGFSRNHIFDPGLSGVEYVTKCLSSVAGGGPGGDFYEGSKFALRSSEVTLANSVVRLVAPARVGHARHFA